MSKGKKAPIKKRTVAAKNSTSRLVKPDIMARLKEVWGDRMLTEAEVKELRDLELEGEEG